MAYLGVLELKPMFLHNLFLLIRFIPLAGLGRNDF
jgi:hypothetical protein